MINEKKGLLLVFTTALISGFSIFINRFGVEGINPYIFTGLKNLVVGVLILSLILFLKERKNLFRIKTKQWLNLAIIGLIGGSIPFLLFFKGLTLTMAAKAGFIHKTLFIYVSILAILFLKEKVNKSLVFGLASLLVGNILFLKIKPQGLGTGDLLIFLATIFWATEVVISKRLLRNMSARIVAFGRMFFGSIFVMLFLMVTGQIQLISQITLIQTSWVLVTSLFLLGYVLTFYTGLKYIPASVATAILTLGAPITVLLSVVFLEKSLIWQEIFGLVFIILGLYSMIKLLKVTNLKNRKWAILEN